jgi:hypothetical protein
LPAHLAESVARIDYRSQRIDNIACQHSALTGGGGQIPCSGMNLNPDCGGILYRQALRY